MQNKKRLRSYLSMIVVLSLVLNLFVSSAVYAADYDTPTEISTIFPDPNFANAMATWLGLTVGDQITRADINTRISAGNMGLDTFLSNKNITNLTGIDIFETTSIDYFNLAGNNIADLSPLSTLTQVTNLVVAGTFSDLSPLSNLTNLTELIVKSNSISDLTPLSTLSSVQTLGINGYDTSNSTNSHNGCSVSSLSGLEGLTSLEMLYITTGADIDNTFLNPLSGLPNLQGINVYGNVTGSAFVDKRLQITNLDALSTIPTLQGVWFENTALNNIDGLSALPSLSLISIRDGQLSDVSSLSGFASKGTLWYIEFSENNIYDISPIDSTFTNLQELWVGSNMISDISSLQGMGLTTLNMHGNFIDVYTDGINKTVATSFGSEGQYQFYLTANALTSPVNVNDTQSVSLFKQTTVDGTTPFGGYNFKFPVASSLVTFSSDDSGIATVNGSGTVTAVGGGSTDITAILNNMVAPSLLTETSSSITVNIPVTTYANNVLIEYRDMTDQNYWTSFLMKNTTYQNSAPVRSSVHNLRSIQYDGVTGDITSTNSVNVGDWIISYDWPFAIPGFNATIAGLAESDKNVLTAPYVIPTGELVKFKINQAELQPADIYSNVVTGNHVYNAPNITGYRITNPNAGNVTLNEDENRTIVFQYEVDSYIQGYVRDTDGNPIQNAIVNIDGTEYTTDATGFYKANLPLNSAWDMSNSIFARKDGYAMTAIDTFSLLPLSVGDPWQDKDFVLVPETGTITVQYLSNQAPNNPVAPEDVFTYPLGFHTLTAKNVPGYTVDGANSVGEMLFFHGQSSLVQFYYSAIPVVVPTPDPTPTTPTPTPEPEPIKNIGVIKGNVRESGTGEPIVGAKVLTIGTDLVPKTTTTDANGRYEFKELPFGSYVMVVKTDNAFFIRMIVVK